MLADVLKTNQSHHKGKKENLMDGNREEDQLLKKVILLEIHVENDDEALLRHVFWSGTAFKEINKNRRYASSKYIFQIVFDE